MTDFEPQEDLPPVAHVTIVYNGPVAPHWDLRVRYGDQKLADDFWARVNARLLLLPKHDPQFRRNKERVNRDAERERIICDWDLGDDDADTSIAPVVEPVVESPAPVADEGGSDPVEDQTGSEENTEGDVVADGEATADEATADEAAAGETTTDDATPDDATTDEATGGEAVAETADA